MNWCEVPATASATAGASSMVNACSYELCNIMHNLQMCSGCQQAWYCSEDHQRKHWMIHQGNCSSVNVDAENIVKSDINNIGKETTRSILLNNNANGVSYGKYGIRVDQRSPENYWGLFATSQSQVQQRSLPTSSRPNDLKIPTSCQTSESGEINAQTRGSQPHVASAGMYWNSKTRLMANMANGNDGTSFGQWQEPCVVSEPSMFKQNRTHSSSSITPSFIAPNSSVRIGENDNYQSGHTLRGDSIVAQDTDQFSEQIRRSSSFPLNPSVENGRTGDTALDNVLTDDDKGNLSQATIQPQSPQAQKSTFILGGDSVNAPMNRPVANSDMHLGIKHSLTEYVTHWMKKYGICVLDNFLTEEKSLNILEEMTTFYGSGRFTAGQLVKGRGDGSTTEVRGDLIAWANGAESNCSGIGHLISMLDSVVMSCQDKLADCGCKISGRTKAMLACYPGNGTRYVKHVDNPSGDGRRITCIYYLNKNWNSMKDGGLLRIYPEGQDIVANIEPLFNRLILFWSDRRNPHEVLPAYSTRFAITVWYFDFEERGRAKIKK